jgi:hypothetical protein
MERESASIPEMLGDFLREASVLIAVFVPLDLVIERKPIPPSRFWPAMLTAALFLIIGIALERTRR